MSDASPEVLDSLGTVRIWSSIIVAPFLIILFLCTAYYMHNNYHKGWVSGHFRVDDIINDTTIKGVIVGVDEVARNISILQGDKIPQKDTTIDVVYDPKDPNTVEMDYITHSTANLVALGLVVFSIMTAAFWYLNFHFRNNPTWKKASGALETADLLSSALNRN